MLGKEGFQANGQWRCVWRVQGCYETSQSDKSRVHWDSNQFYPGQELVDGLGKTRQDWPGALQLKASGKEPFVRRVY